MMQKSETKVLEYLDELEELIEHDLRVPPFRRYALFVNVEEVFSITNNIRLALPKEMREAQRVVTEGSNMIQTAENRATRIVEEAQREAERLRQEAAEMAERITTQEEVTRHATIKARQILQEADDTARETRRAADEYAQQGLKALNEHLTRVLTTIQKGRDRWEQQK
jgi:cell division septum initiation protein DivIVA